MINYKIRLINQLENLDTTLNCPENTFILEAAETNKINLPYSCRVGSCSTCVGKLLCGTVSQQNQFFLDEKQIAKGFILTCVACPTSDITILTNEEENLFEV